MLLFLFKKSFNEDSVLKRGKILGIDQESGVLSLRETQSNKSLMSLAFQIWGKCWVWSAIKDGEKTLLFENWIHVICVLFSETEKNLVVIRNARFCTQNA